MYCKKRRYVIKCKKTQKESFFMKKLIVLLLALSMLTFLASCGEKKFLHCDNCNKEVEVDASSNMEEDWSVFCSDCEKELGLDTIVD